MLLITLLLRLQVVKVGVLGLGLGLGCGARGRGRGGGGGRRLLRLKVIGPPCCGWSAIEPAEAILFIRLVDVAKVI